jgi:hypothetical protein
LGQPDFERAEETISDKLIKILNLTSVNLADHTANKTNPYHSSVTANIDVNGKSKINIVFKGYVAILQDHPPPET